jgi:hypothetical protein
MKKILLTLLVFGIISCNNTNQADGVVLVIYPDKNTLNTFDAYEGYDSVKSCRMDAKKIIGNSNFINPDYECSSNCKIQDDYGDKIYICKKTER